MEVNDTESKEADQLSTSSPASSIKMEVAETESLEGDLSSIDNLGLISQQEYEAQFFGFTPKSFSDGLYNATAEYLHEGLLAVARELSQVRFGEQSEQQLLDAAETAFQHVQPDIAKKFDKLEVYLSQNIFNIPPHVILDEDTVWKEKPEVSDSSVKQCEDEIQKLTEKITALQHANACFRQELHDSEPLVGRLRDVLDRQRLLLSTRDSKSEAHEEAVMLNQVMDSL